MAWVNEASPKQYGKILSRRDNSSNFYFIGSDNGKLYVGIGDGSYSVTSKATTLGTGWHHVAFTFNNTDKTIKLYKDGINTENKTISQSLTSYSALTGIGANKTWGWNNFINGSIDEVKVYSRVLNLAEIRDEFNAMLLMMR